MELASNSSKSPVVLVVDDNLTIRTLVTKQLEKLGINAETAENGAAALDKISEKSYELILMDVMMPEMDGLEATKHIREHEQSKAPSRRTIIIALTGHGSRVECIEAGMDDFIAKPMNIATLKSKLEKWAPSLVVTA